MKHDIEKLRIHQWESLAEDIVQLFCKKQGCNYDSRGWVANCIGDVIEISDCYFNFQDIYLDLKSKTEKGLIFDWYYEMIEKKGDYPNYSHYIMNFKRLVTDSSYKSIGK